MSVAVTLPARFDLSTVSAVADELRGHRGKALRVDAGQVSHLGALGAQLLLTAQSEWDHDVQPFAVTPQSAAFAEQMAQLGLDGHFVAADGTGAQR